ncbi:MAG: hypothetical protein JWN41_697 [Thermoleophilia bacterium]|nr:hypothetical protein [Thermoleophilia bacterium]
MDLMGFEPTTSSMRTRRAPNCATGPAGGNISPTATGDYERQSREHQPGKPDRSAAPKARARSVERPVVQGLDSRVTLLQRRDETRFEIANCEVVICFVVRRHAFARYLFSNAEVEAIAACCLAGSTARPA